MQPRSNKRQKELARAEKRREKDAKRAERKRIKAERPPLQPGDPDPSIEVLPPMAEGASLTPETPGEPVRTGDPS
ncbi:MAG TPA: hypothetical protein VH208_03965 [Myxococcaceae bacterium]|nr:hypothetical protein [Myxococcaceae bacterium]